MVPPHPPTAIVAALVLMVLVAATPLCADGLKFGYVHTKTTLLSGALGACDPSPNVTGCSGGLASVTAFARHAITSGNVSFAVVVPALDFTSAFSSMHPENKGVNINVYRRIHTQQTANATRVVLDNYVTESSLMSSSKLALRTMLDYAVTPLATTIVPVSTSEWRYAVSSIMYVNVSSGVSVGRDALDEVMEGSLSSAIAALLHVDDMSRVWTAPTTLTPAAQAASASDVSQTSAAAIVGGAVLTARRVAGLVVLTSDDVAVTPLQLLSDMLQYELMYVATHSDEDTSWVPSLLPDVFLLQSGSATEEVSSVTVSANYTMSNGTVVSGSRAVLVGAMSKSTSGFLTLDVIEAGVVAAVGRPRGSADHTTVLSSASIAAFNPSEIPDDAKDALYYEDQAYLLNLSRVAASNDPVVGRTLEAMPAALQGPTTYSCYAGECGQSSLVARALQWRFDADMSFINSGGVRGAGWDAGDVHMSDVFAMFPFSNNPCTGTITGLRVFQIYSHALDNSAFDTQFTSLGVDLLQSAGVRIEYALQSSGGVGAKIVSFKVYNKTTGEYEPLQRLRYYTFASNDFLCAVHGVYSSLLGSATAYRGESTNSKASSETLTTISADFLSAITPYTPILSNYYVPVPLSDVESGSRSYLTYVTGASTCTDSQLYDAGVATCIDCPPGARQSPTDPSTCEAYSVDATVDTTPLIIGLAVGGIALLFIVVAVGVLCECRRRSGSRANGNAPRGESDVAVLFTDIKSSTRLWGAVPVSMGVALDLHHQVIRDAIGAYKGYEVKTVGDCFMIAVDDAQRAVDMAVAIQHELHRQEWPVAINAVYDGLDGDCDDVNDDPDDVAGPVAGCVWNGLRVRIGMHYGPVEVVLDAVTKGYDYYGPTVNVAARVEGVTDGGQLCMTTATAAAVSTEHANYTVSVLGSAELRGVKDPVQILTVVPTGLEARVFERRLGDAAAGNKADNDDTDTFSTSSLNAYVPLNATTRPVRDTIRDALKSLRGDDRVGVIEKLRKAWRVQLPEGRHFTGIKTAVVPQPTTAQLPRSASIRERRGSVRSLGSRYSRAGDTQSVINSQLKAEENDEDIIFRSVAQRLAPQGKKDTKPAREGSGPASNDGSSQNIMASFPDPANLQSCGSTHDASFLSVDELTTFYKTSFSK